MKLSDSNDRDLKINFELYMISCTFYEFIKKYKNIITMSDHLYFLKVKFTYQYKL